MALLAIDIGVRCGLACFGDDGALRWYRSRNYGTARRLGRALPRVALDIDDLSRIVCEGDRNLVRSLEKLARKRGWAFEVIGAEQWREALLLPRNRRSGEDAKAAADTRAREIIEASDAPRPTSLRHDAAEAICIGRWAVSGGR